MTHDPLCKLARTNAPVGYIGVTVDCDCHRVRYVRKQVILQCLTAVEQVSYCTPEGRMDAGSSVKGRIWLALRALREKP
jgi:hypothetical protein